MEISRNFKLNVRHLGLLENTYSVINLGTLFLNVMASGGLYSSILHQQFSVLINYNLGTLKIQQNYLKLKFKNIIMLLRCPFVQLF